MNLGETLINVGSEKPHLWIVVVRLSPTEFGMVNITTRRFGVDASCVAMPGDHPFITHESIVLYSAARRAKDAEIQQVIKAGLVIRHEDATPEFLRKVQEAALVSDQSPGWLDSAIRAHLR